MVILVNYTELHMTYQPLLNDKLFLAHKNVSTLGIKIMEKRFQMSFESFKV